MDPFNRSPFEMVAPEAMSETALDPYAAPPMENVVGWEQPQAPEGRGWSDKLQNALMLALSVSPIGRMASSRGGRLALGAGAGAAAGTAMSGAAEAASSGDSVLDALQSQLQIKQGQYEQEYQGTSGTRVKGLGPATQRLGKEIENLTSQIKARQEEIRQQSLIETPAQKLERERMEAEISGERQQRADKRAESNRTRFWQGAGAGAIGGAGLSVLGGALTRGRINRFSKVAEDLKALTPKTGELSPGAADGIAAKVDEANALRGMKKSFGEDYTAPFIGTDKKAIKANTKSRKVKGPDLGEEFEKPYSFGKSELAMPALGAADYGIMTGMAEMQDTPEDAQAYHDMANLGLGFAVGSKGARVATKPFTTGSTISSVGKKGATKAMAPDTGSVNTARNQLQRELAGGKMPQASASPAPAQAPTGGQGGGSQPVRLPPGKGGGLSIDQLQQRAKASAPARSAFHSDPANQNMMAAINAVKGRGARVTTDTVMRELKTVLGGNKVDGVPINRKQVGRWLSRHGHL